MAMRRWLMKTKTIVSPMHRDPQELLTMIETTSDAFTAGRRNNDIVNWFLAKRLLDLSERNDPSDIVYVDDFNHMRDGLTDAQQDSLDFWDEDPLRKIKTLYAHYGKLHASSLHAYWMPMDYEVPGD